MATGKTSWDDIPSLENLSIDWEYEPENFLGKRAWLRLEKNDLHSFLTNSSIPVKIISRNIDKTGQLIDISVGGLAVYLNSELTGGQMVRVGFFLGKQKVISRAIVRNVSSLEEKYRIGLEFIGLEEEDASFIAGLNASKIYKI
jgi:hypothetical protein